MNQDSNSLRREEGTIEEALPGLTFRVKLSDGSLILGHLAGKMRLHHIRIVPGDRVAVDVSPDGERGRIVRRM